MFKVTERKWIILYFQSLLKSSVSQWWTRLVEIFLFFLFLFTTKNWWKVQFELLLLWITCPALFPPPRFGTLSKIQKGGEPVPQSGKRAVLPSPLSVQVKLTTLTCLHVCCAMSCACVCVYRVSLCSFAIYIYIIYILSLCLQPCPFVLFRVGSTLIESKWIII